MPIACCVLRVVALWLGSCRLERHFLLRSRVYDSHSARARRRRDGRRRSLGDVGSFVLGLDDRGHRWLLVRGCFDHGCFVDVVDVVFEIRRDFDAAVVFDKFLLTRVVFFRAVVVRRGRGFVIIHDVLHFDLSRRRVVGRGGRRRSALLLRRPFDARRRRRACALLLRRRRRHMRRSIFGNLTFLGFLPLFLRTLNLLFLLLFLTLLRGRLLLCTEF
mmetsp:Transcript_4443/g.17009  ORF Transcript_4443/g.17009 Transcript_4443/m.17009 type:complete len:217 (+) Transcript_4443:30-680(+)